ncbi:MAG TPA: hypothetical protein ENK57_09835 [Polyangiaceae bacterium]|nr:hypothetical protein [Polyangiaceae bacterium]
MRGALPSQIYEELTRRIKARDPDLVAAVDEVDWTLLRGSLDLSPLERLRASTQTANTLGRLRDAALTR